MSFTYFEPQRLYDDSDVELEILAPRSRRAQWRHQRTGPSYIKAGRRVKYSGLALNEWLEQNTVQTN